MSVTVSETLLPSVTESLISTQLRESDIVDKPSEIPNEQSNDENENTSSILNTITIEVPSN